ncbi:hypothetical protein, partial [Aquabacterium sp.]|uniref:hypothetical protein n=1 Tax=Aquabacterium sp. TaxID=1872578 RepID=UPI002488A5DC
FMLLIDMLCLTHKISDRLVQASAERNVVDVIYESFIVPGDQDYLMARLLAQNGLARGFYWAAAQAAEKYFKAFLLMNGFGVKDFNGHPIKKLFEAAKIIDASFAGLNILPHPSIIVEPSASHYLKKFTIHDFIDELEEHGSANNRYNSIGVEYNTGHLCAIDSLSFKMREKIGSIPISESFKKLNQDLICAFERHNPWFQAGVDHPSIQVPGDEFPIQYSSSVTKFEILTKKESDPAYKIALQWLRAKMKLPPKGGK